MAETFGDHRDERHRSRPMSTGAATRAAAPVPPNPASTLADLDAHGRIAALGKAFEPTPEAEGARDRGARRRPRQGPDKLPRDWQRDFAKTLRRYHSRILKTLVGVVVVAVAGWMPVRALLQTTSTEAIINARLITLRAPIEGQIDRLTSVAVGTELQSGAPLLGIINTRAERGRLDSLAQLVSQLEGEIAALTSRQVSLDQAPSGLFRERRSVPGGPHGAAPVAHCGNAERNFGGDSQARGSQAEPRPHAGPLGCRDRNPRRARTGAARRHRRQADARSARPPPQHPRRRTGVAGAGHLRRRQLQRSPAVPAARRRHHAAAQRGHSRHRPAPGPSRQRAHRARRRDEGAMPAAPWPRSSRRPMAASGKS